jgi:hypothetical protein
VDVWLQQIGRTKWQRELATAKAKAEACKEQTTRLREAVCHIVPLRQRVDQVMRHARKWSRAHLNELSEAGALLLFLFDV